MKIWTFQSSAIAETITNNDIYEVDFEHVYKDHLPVYKWMANEMISRNISRPGVAPIWGWASVPSYLTARLLLSDFELERGIKTIELEVPTQNVLLSSYDRWNDFFFYYLENESFPSRDDFLNMFVRSDELTNGDVQATFSSIHRDWIIDIRTLKLPPDADENFDWEQTV